MKYEERKDDEFFGNLQQKTGRDKDDLIYWLREVD